ncbi:hypothetical protein [uncultured Desulfuromusa sp.]|uniref:hypothetical protein n=1 Tax=uncultured Desulfuromusa sp. TaxID=219183 RepID=UPI002AA8DB20|nr:hypothetical protein [uncultured Desulfuromusa sp.]
MSPTRTYKRKLLNFSIKRDMQFKMIGKIFLILLVSLLLSGVIFYQFANQEITSSFQMFHVKARNFLDFLFPVVLSSFAISLVAGVIGSLFFPKPIAGGLYRIEMDLQQIIDADDFRTQIKLRDGDQLIPLAEQVNRILNDVRTRMNHVQTALQELEKMDAQEVSTEGFQQTRDHLEKGLQNLKI